jgi:hypothetical protein
MARIQFTTVRGGRLENIRLAHSYYPEKYIGESCRFLSAPTFICDKCYSRKWSAVGGYGTVRFLLKHYPAGAAEAFEIDGVLTISGHLCAPSATVTV